MLTRSSGPGAGPGPNESLADERAQGRAIPEIRTGYYKLAVQSHFLFYRISDTGFIDIVRILHQRMDIAKRL